MLQLSPQGQQTIADIAQRHGFSVDAVLSMLQSVINGNGSMAQFNHYEFAGSGQWMSGGMTMVSDMFNNQLKNRVDGLCSELARLVATQPDLVRSGSFQSQSQGAQQQHNFVSPQLQNSQLQSYNAPTSTSAGASLFVPPPPGQSHDWWPSDLRWPNSTGAQNGARYAYFAQARRLAIEVNGKVTVYDTLDHQIGGFSQQQSYGGSISFNSQYGLIDVNTLPVVAVDGVPANNGGLNSTNSTGNNAGASGSGATSAGGNSAYAAPAFAPAPAFTPAASPLSGPASTGNQADIFGLIEKLAELRSRDLLSEDEFIAKKTELLARL